MEVTMRFRLLALVAATVFAGLLAGCAEGPYYGGSYYNSYGYADYDSGPSYYYSPGYYYAPGYYSGYYYGPGYYTSPGYFGFSYRSGDSGRWDGSNWSNRSFQQGSVQTQPRSSTRTVTQPRVRSSSTTVARSGRNVETRPRAARQPSHVASHTRTGPDREHGG
jgi:hypothetical protein